SPSPETAHQRVLLRLGRLLAEYVEARNLGEIFVAPYDVILAEHDIVEPDIIFVAARQRSIVTARNIRGVPELLIEVNSPARPTLDTRTKKKVYARCGVRYYWLVDPSKRTFLELELRGSRYIKASAGKGQDSVRTRAFPKFALALADIGA